MSAAGPWSPDAATVARGNALQGTIPYGGGSEIVSAQEETQKSIPDPVRTFAEWIRTWPGVRSAGMRRSPAKPATPGRRRDLHEEGRAVDAMIIDYGSPLANQQGDALAAFLVRHADLLRVQGVVWRRLEWYASTSGAAWEPYSGPSAHVDHVHIELSPEVLRWTPEEMTRRIAAAQAAERALVSPRSGWGTPVAVALVAVAVAGGIVWAARARRSSR